MRKFGLFLAGGIAAIILLNTIGPMVGLLVCLAILYFIFKTYIKTGSTFLKIGLVIIGLIVLSSTLHHIPALIGVGAAYVLYLVYKNWNKQPAVKEDSDPFVNFEKQWEQLKKY